MVYRSEQHEERRQEKRNRVITQAPLPHKWFMTPKGTVAHKHIGEVQYRSGKRRSVAGCGIEVIVVRPVQSIIGLPLCRMCKRLL